MTTLSRLLLIAIATIGSATAAHPQQKLKRGDPAPPISVDHWVKGEAVESFQAGHVYVLEFWATWCSPCKDAMPHLSDLQQQYQKEITVIGVSDESAETVAQFLKQPAWAEKTQYRMAADPDRSMYRSYMEAAGKKGIPTTFLVDGQGKIAWIGHPIAMDLPLLKLLGKDEEIRRRKDQQAKKAEIAAKALDRNWQSTAAAQAWIQKAQQALRADNMQYQVILETQVMAGMPGQDMEKVKIGKEISLMRSAKYGVRMDSIMQLPFGGMPGMEPPKEVIVLTKDLIYADQSAMSPTGEGGLAVMTRQEGEALKQEFSRGPGNPIMAALFGANPLDADPADAFDKLQPLMALKVESESEQEVFLTGEASPILSTQSMGGENPEPVLVQLTLDKVKGHPLEMRFGDPQNPELHLRFQAFQPISDPNPETFNLNPEGKDLPNLADRIRSMMEQVFSHEDWEGEDEPEF